MAIVSWRGRAALEKHRPHRACAPDVFRKSATCVRTGLAPMPLPSLLYAHVSATRWARAPSASEAGAVWHELMAMTP